MRVYLLLLIVAANHLLFPQAGQWTWMHGDNTINPTPNYGTRGVAAASNKPPGRYEAAEWTDLQGNFWMFGGSGQSGSSSSQSGIYADLWKFNPVTNEWTWMKGSQLFNQLGVYGIQGVPDTLNNPGARGFGAATWVDNSGNLWLFGGNGYGSSGNSSLLNDLWKYTIQTNTWTWMKGSQQVNHYGKYGTRLVSSLANLPRSRGETSASWKDGNGDLWLFGGNPQGAQFNDLWRYTINNNEWTWMHGDTIPMVAGKYGQLGVASPTNCPGSRWVFAKWQQQSSAFFLYGGFGRDVNGVQGRLNDLWSYDPALNEWTWLGGTKVVNEQGTMDSICENVTDIPSGRQENRSSWKINCQLIMFGGYNQQGFYNDMWAFNLNTKRWTWMSGDVAANQPANYGTKLVASPLNKPGSRWGSVGWQDQAGNLWMFGGSSTGSYNDMWKFQPDPLCLNCSVLTGIHESTEEAGLVIYPNPSNDHSTIKIINPLSKELSVKIFNEQGKLIMNFKNNRSEIISFDKELAPGLYLIKMEDEKQTLTRKVIIN